jgi:3-mercaptopyruvate sulfurtransferase SseA
MKTRKRSFALPVLAAAAALLIVGGVYLAIAQPRAVTTPIPPTASLSEVPDEHGSEGLPYPDVPRINATDAKARVDSGKAVLVDVRSQGEFDTAHAQGALFLSLADLEARYRELPQNVELIFYCT